MIARLTRSMYTPYADVPQAVATPTSDATSGAAKICEAISQIPTMAHSATHARGVGDCRRMYLDGYVTSTVHSSPWMQSSKPLGMRVAARCSKPFAAVRRR